MQLVEMTGLIIGLALLVGFIILATSIRVIIEYEKAIIFRFGKMVGARGPGIIFIFPFVEKANIIDMRIRVIEVPRQEVMTADNVPVSTNALCYYSVEDPIKAVVEVEDYQMAIYQLAQATTRTVVGESELDDVLSNREVLNERIKIIIGEIVNKWGILVDSVEIKDVELPQNMKRAMARQAEAERDKRGRIIQAEGEEIAAKVLAEASQILTGNPEAMHLRTLQTLTEIGAEHNTNTVMVVPVEVLRTFETIRKGEK